MDAFLAGITTIPHFKAIMVEDEYYVEGGYLDNTPMRSLFEDPDVDEIIAIDFTDYDYQTELERLYHTQMITLPFNSIDMLLLSSDMELCLPNKKIFSQAVLFLHREVDVVPEKQRFSRVVNRPTSLFEVIRRFLWIRHHFRPDQREIGFKRIMIGLFS